METRHVQSLKKAPSHALHPRARQSFLKQKHAVRGLTGSSFRRAAPSASASSADCKGPYNAPASGDTVTAYEETDITWNQDCLNDYDRWSCPSCKTS